MAFASCSGIARSRRTADLNPDCDVDEPLEQPVKLARNAREIEMIVRLMAAAEKGNAVRVREQLC
jgi:hypothetical protein